MHILIIPSERYVPRENPLEGIFQQHQAHALVRAGHRVGVISPFLWPHGLPEHGTTHHLRGFEIADDQGVSVIRYHAWRLPHIVGMGTWQWIRAAKALFAAYVERHGQPDIVHAHNAIPAGIVAGHIRDARGIPYLLTEHSSAYARKLLRWTHLALARRAFEKADRRLVVSPSLGRALEEAVGNSARPWEYVPNILPLQFEENQLRPAEAASSRSFCLLSVGSLDENKGHADLLRAFGSYFGQDRSIQLRIAGDGPLGQELRQLSQELGIEQQVTFLGQVDRPQVLREMRACDALVLSSRYETFGVALIEALSCGKPVVATRCGGPECIVNSKNGILVPAGNVAALGQAMVTLRGTAHQYDRDRIREDCIARFGEKAVVGRLSAVYDGMLARLPRAD